MVALFAGASVLIIGVLLFNAAVIMPARIANMPTRILAQGFYVALALSRGSGIVKALTGFVEIDAWSLITSTLILIFGLAFSIGMWREIVVKGNVRPWDH